MPRVLEAMEGYRIIENEVLHILLGECVEAIPRLREGIEKVAPEPGQHPCVLRFEDRDDGVDGVQWAQSSFPNPADLDVFEAAAAAPDPLSVLKQRTVAAPSKNPGMTEANRQAGALISIWISHGGYSAELQQALDTSIAGDGARTVVPGLVNLCAHFAAMVGTLIGSSPLSLIGGFNTEAEPPLGAELSPRSILVPASRTATHPVERTPVDDDLSLKPGVTLALRRCGIRIVEPPHIATLMCWQRSS